MRSAAEALAMRGEAIEWLDSDHGQKGMHWMAEQMATERGGPPGAAERLLTQPLRNSARVGETYLIGDDMQMVAEAAGRSMPRQAFMAEDAPSSHGLLFWATKVGPCDALAWETRLLDGSDPGLAITWLVLMEGKLRPAGILALPFGRDVDPVGGTDGARASEHDPTEFVRTILAAWTLMQQPIASNAPVALDRAARRRLARTDESAAVRVIRLRSARGESGEGQGREYHHRWIVRGHWRNQWLPSRQAHRLQWISEHIKGPDDKPLLMGEKVYAWTR